MFLPRYHGPLSIRRGMVISPSTYFLYQVLVHLTLHTVVRITRDSRLLVFGRDSLTFRVFIQQMGLAFVYVKRCRTRTLYNIIHLQHV